MEERSAYLADIEPELQNVTRLFGLQDSVWEQQRFVWELHEEDDTYVCVFRDGVHQAVNRTPVPDGADDRLRILHRKRAARRLCKQTLYDLCRTETGVHPPWGSLTGVRPTHLIYEALEEGWSLNEAALRVQERFDVTAEKAALLAEVVRVQQRMRQPDDGWTDVYIGIPFCTTRCAYCSFSSGEVGDGRLVEPYLQALLQEMTATAQLMQEAGKALRAVYVGGGTPTALNEQQLQRLLAHIRMCFPGACEYTVEAGRPDTITLGKLKAIQAAGVQRISINPQTMNDRTLQVIGRAHTAQQVLDAYAMAREAGIRHINMDVIAGLPGETTEDFARTLAAAELLRPESLTVHTLAIKRSSRMHLENAPLPSDEMAAEMVRLGRAAAGRMGMEAYYLYRQKHMAGQQENVGYAIPGHACQYNVDMMEETTHILAVGAGGISKRVYPEEGRIGRAPNVSNIALYIQRVDEMVQRKRQLFLSAMEAQCR